MSKTIQGLELRNVQYQETRRGIAYQGHVLMDGKPIGIIENEGNGGAVHVSLEKEYREEFQHRMTQYQPDIQEEAFIEDLFDMLDFGRVLSQEERMAIVESQ